jgi:D-alanyl-D-alanine carboxypeptidase
MLFHSSGRGMRLFALALSLVAFIGAAVAANSGARAEPMLLLEPATGKVLYAHDIDRLWRPASLTKIMTAYVVFRALEQERIALDTKISVSEAAHMMQPSKIGLPVGSEVTVDFALKALIIKSANDIAVMLAEAISGTEAAFVEEMNRTARQLGMTQTHFVNPNGLPADAQVTTARDLAKLAIAVRQEFPQYNHLWAMPSMRTGRLRLRSHNSLLRTFEGADGIKTGFICDSGFNIVASAEREGRSLIAVVLGATTPKTREIRAASLLEHGFNMYGWKLFFQTASLATIAVSPSTDPAVSIREAIPMTVCNPRLARRARRLRARKLGTRSKAIRKIRSTTTTEP